MEEESRVKKVERFYNMPFRKVIEEIHLKCGKSIASIEKKVGIGHGGLRIEAKRLGLKVRTNKGYVTKGE